MIDFYGTTSPNVLKVAIMLEEAGLEYRMHAPRMRGEDTDPAFLALNPIAKVPVIVDHNGPAQGEPLFESGAILIYLAESYLPELFPPSGSARWSILKWLMFQMSLVGPMLGQVNHFQLILSEYESYAGKRYRDQATRVYRNIDDRLGVSPFIAGDRYSIADIAIHPWMGYLARHGNVEKEFPNLIAWRDRLDERATVKRGSAAMAEMAAMGARTGPAPSDEDMDRLFARSTPGPKINIESYLARGPMFSAQADRNAKD